MHKYRTSRNCEASIIDFILDALAAEDWKDIRVVKAQSEVYKGSLPCILVNVKDRTLRSLEIGGTRRIASLILNIRLFCTGDGQREDLDDFLVGEGEGIFESDPDYFEYEVGDGIIINKELKGKIIIESIMADKKELENTDPGMLAKEDRYRHLITLKLRVALT